MITIEFLLTSLVVVLIPGTGVIYTVATGLFISKRASFFAAFGCTLGITPSLLASSLGLAAIFHASAIAFQITKILGVIYLFYLAWTMWKASSPISLSKDPDKASVFSIITKGFLINILNPKLSIFFLAFLPQFISPSVQSPLFNMLILGSVFMLMTFIVFVAYGVLANGFRRIFINSRKASLAMQRVFSGSFAALGVKLAFSEQA
jgi:threonine/homoserine/homoserine lactone efflux protein